MFTPAFLRLPAPSVHIIAAAISRFPTFYCTRPFAFLCCMYLLFPCLHTDPPIISRFLSGSNVVLKRDNFVSHAPSPFSCFPFSSTVCCARLRPCILMCDYTFFDPESLHVNPSNIIPHFFPVVPEAPLYLLGSAPSICPAIRGVTRDPELKY